MSVWPVTAWPLRRARGGYDSAGQSLSLCFGSGRLGLPVAHFNQGMQPDGPDFGDPLDDHAWAARYALASGQPGIANAVMTPEMLAPFAATLNGVGSVKKAR